MRTLLTTFLAVALIGSSVLSAKAAGKTAAKAKAVTCMNDFSCQMGEKCVKYPSQNKGFCAQGTNGSGQSAFQPPAVEKRQPAGRENCSIAAEGQCLKKN